MRIDVVGTGDVYSDRLSPCMIINKEMMFDMPNGSIKKLHKMQIDVNNINKVLISHFHADHSMDIPFFLLEKNLYVNSQNNEETIFVGPKGLNKHIDSLLNVAYSTIDWNSIQKNIKYKIIELDDKFNNIELDKYNIRSLPVEHSQSELCLGYLIDDGQATVAFTGDSKLCKNIETLVKMSKVCFADMSSEESLATHMGLKDIEYLKNLNKEKQCEVYPVHTSDNVLKKYIEKGYKVINDGDYIII